MTLFVLASLKTLFIDKAENVLTLLGLKDRIPTVKRIVLTKKLPADKESQVNTKANETGVEILTYSQLLVN